MPVLGYRIYVLWAAFILIMGFAGYMVLYNSVEFLSQFYKAQFAYVAPEIAHAIWGDTVLKDAGIAVCDIVVCT